MFGRLFKMYSTNYFVGNILQRSDISFAEAKGENLMNTLKLNKLLDSYYKDFDKNWFEEEYKWTELKIFQEKFDLNSKPEAFAEMLKASIDIASNLFASQHYYPINEILLLCDAYPQKVQKAFAILLNEKADLLMRVNEYRTIIKALKNHAITFTPMAKFPAVKRDLALLLDKKITFKEVRDIALRTEKNLLKSVNLFDVYEGEKLGVGKKSYAVSFLLQDEEKTLTDKQIDKIMNKLMGAYKHLLNAEIR